MTLWKLDGLNSTLKSEADDTELSCTLVVQSKEVVITGGEEESLSSSDRLHKQHVFAIV